MRISSNSESQLSSITTHTLRITHDVLRFIHHVISAQPALLLILALFTALTLYQAVTLPLGEADDETDHYQYLRFVARTGHPPLSEAERREAGFKGGLAPLYYWLTAWPIALVGEETQPDIRRVDARPERHIPSDGLGINHVMHTLDEQWPWRGQPLAWRLVRLLSLPMGWVTIIATYALARRLLLPSPLREGPEKGEVCWPALGAAAFVAFLPRFVISSAVINDDNLVFALIALLLLVQVIILQSTQPPTPRHMALFGALFGLTLVTKYFSLILIPEILFTLWLAHRKTVKYRFTSPSPQSPTPRFASLLPITSFLLSLLLTAGLWFIFITIRFNRIDELGLIPGLAASLGEPQITEGLAGLLSGQSIRPVAATYTFSEWFGLLYRSFWFEYGWMRIFAPTWVYILFTLFLFLALLGLIGKLLLNLIPTPSDPTPPPTSSFHVTMLLTLHLLLFFIVVLARYILSATIDTGQGRHLYPALPIIAFLIALGLAHLHFTFYALYTRTAPLQQYARHLLPTPYAFLFTSYSRFLIYASTLLVACFVFPALATLQPANFILPRYQILPVTTTQPAAITYPVAISFADGLALVGLEVTPTASAGSALPVVLYWHADKEAQQDYLIDLCLQDEANQPVACWRGHFADGRYPARAWEAGDTLIDTIHLPIPTCYRILDQPYQLHLQLWPLDPTQPMAVSSAPPVLQHTFTQPQITIRAADSLRADLSQTVDLWRAGQRLTQPAVLELRQSLSQITYAAHDPDPSPKFTWTGDAAVEWQPLPQFQRPLYLPCDDGPSPFAHLAHFMVEPTLANGVYRSKTDTTLPEINLALRDRRLAPLTSTLTFSHTLSINDQLVINNEQLPIPDSQSLTSPSPSSPTLYFLLPTSNLPISIRWQSHRWMAEPLIIALKLLDKDFAIGGERVVTLGNRYPNLLWIPGERVEETYPLHLDPAAPPGLYRLEMSLLRQDKSLPNGYETLPIFEGETMLGHNIYPLTVRLLDPAHDTPPPQPFQAQIGDTIHLVGYDVNPLFSDSPPAISLALYWQSTAKIPNDYTVFTQLLGPDGQVWAQWDNPPQAGRYPTPAWAASDRVVDRYRLALREGSPAGTYTLLVGMYDSNTRQRLPVTINGQSQPDNAIELTTLLFTP